MMGGVLMLCGVLMTNRRLLWKRELGNHEPQVQQHYHHKIIYKQPDYYQPLPIKYL